MSLIKTPMTWFSMFDRSAPLMVLPVAASLILISQISSHSSHSAAAFRDRHSARFSTMVYV
jgi:hypothetical protein